MPRGATSRGATVDVASGHPFVGTTGFDLQGIPMGVDLRTGKAVCLDFWWLKSEGLIDSTWAIVMALKGGGKSALEKMLLYRTSCLAPGGTRFQAVINDRKPEGAAGDDAVRSQPGSEYGKLTELLNSTPHYMANMQVNPFERELYADATDDPLLYETAMLKVAKVLAEYDRPDQPLTELEYYSLRVALSEMLSCYHELSWSPSQLVNIWSRLNEAMVGRYHDHLDLKLVSQHKDVIAKVTENMSAQASDIAALLERDMHRLLDTPRLMTFRDLVDAGISGAARLANLLNGEVGRMFGEKNSMYALYQQTASTRVWNDVSLEAQVLWRFLFSIIDTSVMMRQRLHMMPHFVLDDEQHMGMQIPGYAEQVATESALSRSNPIVRIGSAHFFNSLRAGSEDSSTYRAGNAIIGNTGLFIMGRVAPDRISEVRAIIPMTDAEAELLMQLRRYQFAAKLHGMDRPMTFFQTTPTPFEMSNLLDTDAASRKMTYNHDVNNEPFARSFIRTYYKKGTL